MHGLPWFILSDFIDAALVMPKYRDGYALENKLQYRMLQA